MLTNSTHCITTASTAQSIHNMFFFANSLPLIARTTVGTFSLEKVCILNWIFTIFLSTGKQARTHTFQLAQCTHTHTRTHYHESDVALRNQKEFHICTDIQHFAPFAYNCSAFLLSFLLLHWLCQVVGIWTVESSALESWRFYVIYVHVCMYTIYVFQEAKQRAARGK